MADNKDALRALKIKTGVLRRAQRELAMYRAEIVSEGAKLDTMKANGRDPHDIKQQDQVLGESSMMIGDCTTRRENAYNDLLAAMVRPRKEVILGAAVGTVAFVVREPRPVGTFSQFKSPLAQEADLERGHLPLF